MTFDKCTIAAKIAINVDGVQVDRIQVDSTGREAH